MSKELPDWLQHLEREAAARLEGKMLGFAGGEFACPWLRWYFKRHRHRRPATLLVLQDWGVVHKERVPIHDAVREIISPGGDRSIRNVFGRELTSDGLQDGSLCIMTAVWGLRPTESSSARTMLKKDVHEAAWPIWAAAVRHLAPTKMLVTAGKWAEVASSAKESSARDFLRGWERWMMTQKLAPRLSGVDYQHWDHPSLWGQRG